MKTAEGKYKYGAEYDNIKDMPLLPSGGHNAYRVAQFLGQAGSRKESTWDRASKTHTCCGSKVAWRHKAGCALIQWDESGGV